MAEKAKKKKKTRGEKTSNRFCGKNSVTILSHGASVKGLFKKHRKKNTWDTVEPPEGKERKSLEPRSPCKKSEGILGEWKGKKGKKKS